MPDGHCKHCRHNSEDQMCRVTTVGAEGRRPGTARSTCNISPQLMVDHLLYTIEGLDVTCTSDMLTLMLTCIGRAGGAPMHYSNADAAALE